MEEKSKSQIGKFKPVLEWLNILTPILAFLILMTNNVVFIKGNFSTFLVVTAAIIIILTYLVLIYVIRAKEKKESPIVGVETSGFQYAFTARNRQLSYWGIYILTFLIILSAGIYYFYKTLPTNKIVILVADFEEPDQPNQKQYKVTEEIVERLRERTKEFKDIEIKTLDEHLSYKDGKEKATEIGFEKKASLVIWGGFTLTQQKTRVNVNFEILQKPSKLTLNKDKIISILPVNEIESFSLQLNLSEQISFLALVVDGLAKLETENFENSISSFTEALSHKETSSELVDTSKVLYFRASAFISKSITVNNDDLKKAISDLQEAIKIQPNFPEAYQSLGFCYFAQLKLTDSLIAFNKALELNPNLISSHILKGYIFAKQYRFEDAKSAFENAIKVPIEKPEDLLDRGFAKIFSNQIDGAIEDFNSAATQDKNLKPQSLVNLALAYGFKKDYRSAEENLNQFYKLKKDINKVTLIRAVVYILADEKYKAIQTLSELIDKDASDFFTRTFRGQFYLENENFEYAIQDFNNAIKLSKNNSVAYAGIGRVLFQKNKFEESIANFTNAINIEPESAEYYLLRAKSYKEINKFVEAISDINKALEIYSYYTDAYILQGETFLAQKNSTAALVSFSNAVVNYSKDEIAEDYLQPLAYLKRGESFNEIGNLDEAIKDFTKVIELVPTFTDGYDKRAEVYSKKAKLVEENARKLSDKGDISNATEGYKLAVEFTKLASSDLKQSISLYANKFFELRKKNLNKTISGLILNGKSSR